MSLQPHFSLVNILFQKIDKLRVLRNLVQKTLLKSDDSLLPLLDYSINVEISFLEIKFAENYEFQNTNSTFL